MLSSVQLFFSRFLVRVGDAIGFETSGVDFPARNRGLYDSRMCDFPALSFKASFFYCLMHGRPGNAELLCGFGDGVSFFGCHLR